LDYKLNDNNIYCYRYQENDGILFHKDKPKGANLRELADDITHQSNWETPDYIKIFNEFLKGLNISDAVVADIGCGDGRFVEYLIEKGFKKIVAVDSQITPLISLSNYLKDSGNEYKVLLIHTSVEEIPIKSSTINLMLAINVFYYLGNNRFSAMREAIRCLSSDGIAIFSEHSFEAISLRSLMYNGIEDFINTISTGYFRESMKEEGFRFPLQFDHEIENMYNELGLRIVDVKGISLFHQFISLFFKKNQVPSSEIQKYIGPIKDFFSMVSDEPELVKTKIYKIQKLKKI
jgi:ubiquinone/menaquinone biosynthesis C-methylase UbiE